MRDIYASLILAALKLAVLASVMLVPVLLRRATKIEG